MHVPQTEVILRHANAELARVTLPPGEYVIGRSAEAPIRADTQLLSRQHARLTINYDNLLLEDLGSANGTFVNEQPVTEATRLFPNQSIRLGPDITLEVRRQRAPTEPGVSLAPAQAAIARHLPDELLAEKRYAIGSVIAQGGMGAILDAQQAAMKRRVAMKVMLETGDEGDVLRFIDEAQITGQLDHPNIVPIYELGVDEQGQVFYTMKMVRGITLKKVLQLLAEGTEATVKKYPLPALLTVFQKACDAVAFAHSKGVIHRDLKPENIMLGDFGSVLVMDWGLAKVLPARDGSPSPGRDGAPSHPGGFGETALPQDNAPGTDGAVPSSPAGSVLSARASEPQYGSTLAGTILGTPAYMSPEQARGEVEKLDARSDIYALGVILFEILHLRSAVRGANALHIVDQVQRGEIEWTAPEGVVLTSKPKAFPASLLAVCRKALALNPAARYARVEDLQADLLAYQTGFATSAEKAGLAKQLLLALKRHKIAVVGLAAVLLVGSVFGGRAFVEGRRAARALADLKKTAPAMLQLAESEAGLQRFDSALEKIDTALALDPDLRAAYWRRAWVLIGSERWGEAIQAIGLAQQKDPAHAKLATILPIIEQLAQATNENDRWNAARAEPLLAHLASVGATGEIVKLSGRLLSSAKAKSELIRARLQASFGATGWEVRENEDGGIAVYFPKTATTLEALRGLPIDHLHIEFTAITDLEPLRGLKLRILGAGHTKIADLSPLQGMPLRELHIAQTNVKNLSALRGAPLEKIVLDGCTLIDLSALRGAPLTYVDIQEVGATDLNFLAESPISHLKAYVNPLTDISALRGKPLNYLSLDDTAVTDISALRGSSVVELHIGGSHIRDYSPLLDMPKLEKLAGIPRDNVAVLRKHASLRFIGTDANPVRPVAQFWAEYDAQHTPETK